MPGHVYHVYPCSWRTLKFKRGTLQSVCYGHPVVGTSFLKRTKPWRLPTPPPRSFTSASTILDQIMSQTLHWNHMESRPTWTPEISHSSVWSMCPSARAARIWVLNLLKLQGLKEFLDPPTGGGFVANSWVCMLMPRTPRKVRVYFPNLPGGRNAWCHQETPLGGCWVYVNYLESGARVRLVSFVGYRHPPIQAYMVSGEKTGRI